MILNADPHLDSSNDRSFKGQRRRTENVSRGERDVQPVYGTWLDSSTTIARRPHAQLCLCNECQTSPTTFLRLLSNTSAPVTSSSGAWPTASRDLRIAHRLLWHSTLGCTIAGGEDRAAPACRSFLPPTWRWGDPTRSSPVTRGETMRMENGKPHHSQK